MGILQRVSFGVEFLLNRKRLKLPVDTEKGVSDFAMKSKNAPTYLPPLTLDQ
jgi:hypothetical protein